MAKPSNDEMAKIVRQWTPQSLALFYNWIRADEGMSFPDHLWPVACALCDRRIKRLMLIIGPGCGKSDFLSTIYPAWLLGHNPKETIMTVSGSEGLAGGFVSGCMRYIKDSDAFKICFPQVKPDKELGWSKASGMFVTGSRVGATDASYNAFGLSSKELTGKHATTLIFDDLHTPENSATAEGCKDVVKLYYEQLVGRADARGGRYIIAGRRWNVDDLYGHLGKSEAWVVMTLPAERPNSRKLYYDIMVPDHLECIFTDGFCETFDSDFVQITDKPPKPIPMAKNYRIL